MDASRTRFGADTSQPVAPRTRAEAGGLSILVVLFLIGLVIPSIIEVGTLRLSVYRIGLLLLTVPCIFFWLSGRAGRIRLADITIILYWAWSALSFTMHHGFGSMIERNGISFIETVGTYLLARCFIRTAEDFRAMVRVLYYIVMAMLPFALYETLTGHALMMEIFGIFSDVPNRIEKEPRLGLYRVQGPFEHQILFGVFCGSILAMVHLCLGYGEGVMKRGLRSGSLFLAAFLSLSSGPLASQVVQILLLGWNWVMRKVQVRWKILAWMAGGMIALIEAVSNRSTPEILISYFAFDPWTAWNRIRIWNHGSANVAANPVFGIGLNDWDRPAWMLSSVDMFWLLPAMQNGLPAALLLFSTLLLIFLQATFRKGLDPRTSSYRTGYLISMMGLFLAGWTVHYWNATYVLAIFLIGSGAWFADAAPETEDAEPDAVPAGRRPMRYSRSQPVAARKERPT